MLQHDLLLSSTPITSVDVVIHMFWGCTQGGTPDLDPDPDPELLTAFTCYALRFTEMSTIVRIAGVSFLYGLSIYPK